MPKTEKTAALRPETGYERETQDWVAKAPETARRAFLEANERFMSSRGTTIITDGPVECEADEDPLMKDFPLVEEDGEYYLMLYGSIETENYRQMEEYWLGHKPMMVSGASVQRALLGFKGDKLTVRINCRGGVTREASVITVVLTELREKGVEVNCRVDGLSASAAIWPMLACERIEGFALSEYMLHQGWACICGNETVLRTEADNLKRLDDAAFEFEGKRIKGGADKVRELSSANNGEGTWLTPQEALELNMIDAIFEPEMGKPSEPKSEDPPAPAAGAEDPPAPEMKAKDEDERIRKAVEKALAEERDRQLKAQEAAQGAPAADPKPEPEPRAEEPPAPEPAPEPEPQPEDDSEGWSLAAKHRQMQLKESGLRQV